ncbi:MAG: hypothetical protein ACLTS6_15010 [Anaerobutyricum sp.]
MTPSILKSVGKYTAADRAYIFEWNSEKKESFKNTFEWCASGIEPQIQNLQEVPVCLMLGTGRRRHLSRRKISSFL